MYRVFFFLASFILVFSGCDKFPGHNTEDIVLNDTIRMQYQKSYGYPGGEYTIRLDSVKDSRCPIGAYCFWAGTAYAGLTFIDSRDQAQYFELEMGTLDSLILGYKFSFIALDPYPDIIDPSPLQAYEASVIVRE